MEVAMKYALLKLMSEHKSSLCPQMVLQAIRQVVAATLMETLTLL
jgi:hypothetical protein